MRLVKSVRSSALATLVVFGLAACGESPMAPIPESPALSPGDAELLMARAGGADNEGDHYWYDAKRKSGTRTFRIRPGKPVLKKLGEHVLWMPANVVCDPATSGYGPSHWDVPCRPITQPIDVTAKWTTINGQAVITFEPDLRFVSTNDRSRWVMLWVKHSDEADPAAKFAVLWQNPETLEWVDEGASDPTLQASFDWHGRIVSRRLKHFSNYRVAGRGSYNVTSGRHNVISANNGALGVGGSR
jgi:hypothetical protein